MFTPKIKKSRGPSLTVKIQNTNSSSNIDNDNTNDDKKKPLRVQPPGNVTPYEFTDCGSFKEDDVQIGSKGLKISSSVRAPEVYESISKNDIEITNEILGSGSSCTVRKGILKDSNREVALKIMALNLEENIRKKVLLELKTLYTCNHEAIVKFFGAYCIDGSVTIVLEYMDLGTLSSLLDLLGPMPESVIGEMAYSLLSAINYMNKDLRIVHRDIKPSNILINGKGEAKLSDFGVSGKLENTIGQAMTFAGTVTYMSPERISGKPHSSSSDIWSLGLTLLQCSLGYFPYTPDEASKKFTFFQLLERILNQPVPKPPDSYSHLFKSFINDCLIKDPNDRPTGLKLIDHPFIMKHSNSSKHMKEWVNKALVKLGRESELIDLSKEIDHPVKIKSDHNSPPRDTSLRNSDEKKLKNSKEKKIRKRGNSVTSDDSNSDDSSDKKEKKKKRRDKSSKKKKEKSPLVTSSSENVSN